MSHKGVNTDLLDEDRSFAHWLAYPTSEASYIIQAGVLQFACMVNVVGRTVPGSGTRQAYQQVGVGPENVPK